LPGDGGVSARLRRSAADLRFPRVDGSEHISIQRAAAPCDGTVRPRWPLRPLPDVPARHAAARVARDQLADPQARAPRLVTANARRPAAVARTSTQKSDPEL